MDLTQILLIILVVFVVVGIFFLLKPQKLNSKIQELEKENGRLMAEKEQKIEELERRRSELSAEKEKKAELEGKGKRFFVENTNLQEESKSLKEKVSRYEAEKKQKEEKQEELIKKLSNARDKLEDEQERIRKEDEEQKQKELVARDRMWNEHENRVLSLLREICQKPEIAFNFHDNTNLPEEFHGHFKPDFLIDFLGQYLYLDAKVSRSENLENYLKAQFKSTAEKLKQFDEEGKIYKNIFFVVPKEAISDIKKRVESIEGFAFFVISPEAIEPLLFAYKRITEYENLEEFDPQEREKIVEVLANFEHFIKNQNAANLLIAQKAFETIKKRETLPPNLIKQFELEIKKLKPMKLKESDFKKMSKSVEEQEKTVGKLLVPEAKITEDEVGRAKGLL